MSEPYSRHLMTGDLMEGAAFGAMLSDLERRGARPATPVVVGWLVTDRCQLRCRHCWVGDRRTRSLAADARRLVAERLATPPSARVCLSGGEVTLLPDLGELVAILKAGGRPVAVYTNAIAPLDGPAGDTWLAHWDSAVDYVMVSLDGGDAASFDAQRGHGSFAKFVAGVQALRARKVRILAHYVASPFNGGDVHSAAALARDLGCEAFAASFVYPRGRARDLPWPTILAAARAFNAAALRLLGDASVTEGTMRLALSFPNVVPGPAGLPRRRPSAAELSVPITSGQTHAFVTASGDLVPATHLRDDPEQRFGSLLEAPLTELWNRAPLVRRLPRVRDLRATRCADCHDFAWCRGGHHYRAEELAGSHDRSDPWCFREPRREAATSDLPEGSR